MGGAHTMGQSHSWKSFWNSFWLYGPETAEFKNKFMNYGSKWGKKRWCKHTLLGIFQWILAGSKGHKTQTQFMFVESILLIDPPPPPSLLSANEYYRYLLFDSKIHRQDWVKVEKSQKERNFRPGLNIFWIYMQKRLGISFHQHQLADCKCITFYGDHLDEF